MEMPLGGIGPGLVPLMIGALPVVTTGGHLIQTNAGQVVDSQLRDGNATEFGKVHSCNFICSSIILYFTSACLVQVSCPKVMVSSVWEHPCGFRGEGWGSYEDHVLQKGRVKRVLLCVRALSLHRRGVLG